MKTALITGASRGIGAAAAERLAAAGYSVLINYCSAESAAAALCGKIRAAGGDAEICRADVRDPRQVGQMLDSSPFGLPDVLVNNAGRAYFGLLQDMSDSDYGEVMDTNVRGLFNVCRAALPGMIRRGSGSIINISSVWGKRGASCETVYSASKAAVIGFTRALAKEVGPSGVRVNCICPGVIETDMLSRFGSEDKARLAEETPLGRLGNAEDVAGAVLFFAEEPFVTGQILDVSGGFAI